jgi:hypothetical protein
MPTHPIDAVFLRLWTLATGLEGYVKEDWKTVQRVINAHCYGPGPSLARVANAVQTMWAGRYTLNLDDLEVPPEHQEAFPCPVAVNLGELAVAASEIEGGRPFLSISTPIDQTDVDAIRKFVDQHADTPFQAPETAQGSRVLPGEWLCRTCGFKMSKRTLNPRSGAVGTDALLALHLCPNDGALMDQATEADVIESLNECVESWIDALEEAGGSWQHVDRNLPEIGERVLVTVRYEIGAVVTFGRLNAYNDRDGNQVKHWTTEDTIMGRTSGRVTHWKKVPKVPDEDLGAGPGGTCSVAGPE